MWFEAKVFDQTPGGFGKKDNKGGRNPRLRCRIPSGSFVSDRCCSAAGFSVPLYCHLDLRRDLVLWTLRSLGNCVLRCPNNLHPCRDQCFEMTLIIIIVFFLTLPELHNFCVHHALNVAADTTKVFEVICC